MGKGVTQVSMERAKLSMEGQKFETWQQKAGKMMWETDQILLEQEEAKDKKEEALF